MTGLQIMVGDKGCQTLAICQSKDHFPARASSAAQQAEAIEAVEAARQQRLLAWLARIAT